MQTKLFEMARGKQLKGSTEMGQILEDVRTAHNWAPLYEINRYRTFVAPAPLDIAKKLLPEYSYSEKKLRTKKDITNLLKKDFKIRCFKNLKDA